MAVEVGWELLARVAGVCLTAVLARSVWQNRATRGSRDLAALLGSIAGWNALALLPVAGGPARVTLAVAGTMLALLAGVAYYLFIFTLKYSGRSEWISPRRRLIMLAHPAAILLLTLTDQSVGLVPTVLQQSLLFADVSLASGPIYRASISWNIAFLFHLLYTYLLVVASTYFIVDVVRSANSVYTPQAVLSMGAIVVPWASSIASFFFGLLEGTLGISFCLTGALLFVAVRRHELSDLTPVARNAVFDSIDGGVLVLDGENRIVDVNPAAATFLQLDNDVIGQPVADVLAHLDGVWERYADVYETRDELSVETDAGWRHYVVDISPLENRHEDGAPARTVLINDVTEQKRREQELEAQKERLDEFASLVSHDLRNPINVARGHLDLVRETGSEESIDEVEVSLERMETIIDEVLTIARTGQWVADTEIVSVEQLAREAWRTVDTKDVTLAVETDAWIEADDERLRRAFENLFRNALDHGGEGLTTIGVGALGRDEQVFEPEEQGIYVADDGCGIPPGERDDVLEAGHTTDPEGTGLGLSIVESVAEAHGWTVSVAESDTGGAQFELRGTTIHDERTEERSQGPAEEPST